MMMNLHEMSIEQIMAERKVDQRDAYELRRQATADIQAQGADHSLATRIVDVLKNGSVKDVEELRQALFFKHEDLNASPLEITKAVWSLQKRGMVTFYERKAGKDSLLTRIKLTKNALKDLGIIPTPDHTRPSKVTPSRELKRPSPVGKDMTHPERHPTVAKGGEVERTVDPARATGKPKKSLMTDVLTPYLPIRRSQDPPRSNEKPLTDEEIRREFSAKFPLISEILERNVKQESYLEAAKALEGIDDEMSLELMSKVDLTPLEREIVALVLESSDRH